MTTTNTLVPAGALSRSVVAGQHYRLSGLIRGNKAGASDISDDAVMASLIGEGLGSVSYYAMGAVLPADWPDDSSMPAPGADERVWRAEGNYQGTSGSYATALAVGPGTATVYLMWNTTQIASTGAQSYFASATAPTYQIASNAPKAGLTANEAVAIAGVVLAATGWLIYVIDGKHPYAAR